MITLATLHQATAQQVFEHVARHLITQNKKSEDYETQTCKYRDCGQKCAAGCLMSDEEYSFWFEGREWEHLVAAGLVPDCHGELISRLQTVHDKSNPPQWRAKLQLLAKELSLRFSEDLFSHPAVENEATDQELTDQEIESALSMVENTGQILATCGA